MRLIIMNSKSGEYQFVKESDNFTEGKIFGPLMKFALPVIAAGWEYLKAHAIDCLLTSIFFVLAGYFNGCGYTKFVVMENIIGAASIRVPVSWVMSSIQPVSLFRIGLATPSSSFVQVVLCTLYYFHIKKGQNSLS